LVSVLLSSCLLTVPTSFLLLRTLCKRSMETLYSSMTRTTPTLPKIVPDGTGSVAPLQTRKFTISLYSDNAQENNIVLTSPGYGKVTIAVTNKFPCEGCDGVAGSVVVVDKCGICAGGNTCLGCDSVAFSGLLYDKCGVCGGNGLSCAGECKSTIDKCGVCGGNDQCLGCDSVAWSGSTYDECGVCNGVNECRGCDGVAYSGKVDDKCGVCDGDDACLGCDGMPNSGAVVDACGVCGGKSLCLDCPEVGQTRDKCLRCLPEDSPLRDLCLGCDGQPAAVGEQPAKYDKCGVCGGENLCIGCDGVEFSGKVWDSCNVCGGDAQSCAEEEVGNTTVAIVIPPETPILTPQEAGFLAAGIATAVVGVIAAIAVAAFLAYQQNANPYWLVPAGMAPGMNAPVGDNPLYTNKAGWKANAIAD